MSEQKAVTQAEAGATIRESREYKRPRHLKSIDYHRNGVGGLGFHVLIVRDEGRDMLVVRFGLKDDGSDTDQQAGGVLCAAFDLAKLDARNIAFFENSYRGDYYATLVDPIIRSTPYEEMDSAVRAKERP